MAERCAMSVSEAHAVRRVSGGMSNSTWKQRISAAFDGVVSHLMTVCRH